MEKPKLAPLYSGSGSLHDLAEMGVNAWSVTMEHEKEHIYNYYKHRIPIGLDEVGEPVLVNLNQAQHLLLLGGTGSGKTFFMRGLMNRFTNAKGSVAIPTDVKPEYSWSRKTVQPRFYKFLLPDEKPRGYPIRSYRPHFLSKLTNIELQKGENTCQISLDDITKDDFYTLLNITDLTDAKRVAIDNAFQKVKDGELSSLSEMCQDIKNNNEIVETTKKSIIGVISAIEKMGVIGDRFEKMDFVTDLRTGRIPVMNLAGAFTSGNYDHFASAYVAFVMRQLLDAKASGRFPQKQHILIMLDEINRYASNTGDSVAKAEILRALDIFRYQRGIMCFSSQDYRRIPPTIMEQCSYIFVSYKTTLDSLKYIIKQCAPQEVDHWSVFEQDMAFLLGSMKKHRDGSRDWLCIDRESKKRPFILRPLAPLSCHRTEGM